MALARGMSVRKSLDTHETCVSSCVETLKTMEPSLLKPEVVAQLSAGAGDRSAFVLGAGEVLATETALTGGKGSSLAILNAIAGVAVPTFFCVTTAAYRAHFSTAESEALLAGLQALSDGFRPSAGSPSKRSELENAAEANGMAELFAKAAELRAHIASSPLSDAAAAAVGAALAAASLAERPVAVRSSATSEDGAEASFAGQHDTFLSGQDKRAKFPTSKAPISVGFHSFFRLIFGRAIISRSGLEAWMLFPKRARAEHSR